jgi:hypothetical protein
MKKSHLVRVAILLLIALTMSGCIWAIEDDRPRGGDSHGRDRGEHRGESHEHRGESR